MEKSGTIRKYELIVIVDAKLPAEEKDGICKDVLDAVDKAGGKVINNQVWMEKHKMTFDIKKVAEGTYYLINLEGEGSVISKLRASLRLKEKVLRSSIISVESH